MGEWVREICVIGVICGYESLLVSSFRVWDSVEGNAKAQRRKAGIGGEPEALFVVQNPVSRLWELNHEAHDEHEAGEKPLRFGRRNGLLSPHEETGTQAASTQRAQSRERMPPYA